MEMYLSQYEDIQKELAGDDPDFWKTPHMFQVQNVADWMHGTKWSDVRKKIFIVTPPYPLMWMEFSNRKGFLVGREWQAFGGFVVGDMKEDHSCKLRIWVFFQSIYGTTSVGGCEFSSTEDGSLLDEYKIFLAPYLQGSGTEKDDEQMRKVIWRIASVFLTSISLMHIKNIELDPIPVAPKVREARKRRGLPDVTFKTLRIEPMRKQLQRQYEENPNGPNSLDLAFHFVRGHFKDFREKGLFGRESLRGVYWWDAHARGDENNGRIIKDYEVKI